MGAVAQICEWQFMHVFVGGMPANGDVSTDVWQYRQSMPSSRTWWRWLNCTGCSTYSCARVAYEERPMIMAVRIRPATNIRRPARLSFERVLALRWKICGIGC
ncbi:hypothetical protein D3C83_51050 [compost metagenome]